MRKALTTNWNTMRVMRVAMGAAALGFGILRHDNLLMAAGGFLLFMGLTNTGCCAAGGCVAPLSRPNSSSKGIEGTTFEEVR